MLHFARRKCSIAAAVVLAGTLVFCIPALSDGDSPAGTNDTKRVAAVVTEYRHNSHADVIVSRLFQTQTLDGKGDTPLMRLMSVFTDQIPENDLSRPFARQYGFRISDTVADALTLDKQDLAVDGVLLVAEHGKYDLSDTGQTRYPKKRLFDEVAKVFRVSKRSVPVFIDKHLADNWRDAKYIYDTARELDIPLMAGSSLPVLWRQPPADVRHSAKLKQIVAISYGSLDAYGFHALEMVEALAERRFGGETGVKAVQCLVDRSVWSALEAGGVDRELFEATLARLKKPPDAQKLADLVPNPVLFVIEFADGLRASVLTLNGAVDNWSAAWRYDDDSVESTLFAAQDARPFMHFAYLVQGIDDMMQTGKPTWPVERTLLTSGALHALLISKKEHGRRVETPYLDVKYQSHWNWQQPPPPPPDRPIDQQ
ncbi:MAG TPA: hypothetical protein VKU82_12585 [Planctomycetaceae bacterium]|nr:hypothetical protein [Planctomycetaceae bacterium]